MRMCFQTTNIDFKHRPFIVSQICTQSLPPRSPMRNLQYVGQVWHAVVSWSDFPSRECLRPELSAIGPVRHPVVSSLIKEDWKYGSSQQKKMIQNTYLIFVCGIFCMTTVTTQKKHVLYSYVQRSFLCHIFKLLVLEPWKHMITISLALAFSFLSLRSHWSLWGLAPIKRFTSDW